MDELRLIAANDHHSGHARPLAEQRAVTVMYTTVVVALDLEPDGDRALPVVRALSELADVSIELLSVTPRREELEVDAFELSRRATANGWPAHSYSVLRSDDPAGSIAITCTDDRTCSWSWPRPPGGQPSATSSEA